MVGSTEHDDAAHPSGSVWPSRAPGSRGAPTAEGAGTPVAATRSRRRSYEERAHSSGRSHRQRHQQRSSNNQQQHYSNVNSSDGAQEEQLQVPGIAPSLLTRRSSAQLTNAQQHNDNQQQHQHDHGVEHSYQQPQEEQQQQEQQRTPPLGTSGQNTSGDDNNAGDVRMEDNDDASADAPLMHLQRRPSQFILPDPEVPYAFELKDELLIGRGSGVYLREEGTYTRMQCDRLPLMISREHAKFRRIRNAWYIIDLQSRNGTYLNSQQLTSNTAHPLNENDVVSFGGPQHVQVEGSRSMNPFVFRVVRGQMPSHPRVPQFPQILKASTEPSSSDLQCNICLNVLNAPRTLSTCGHSFCGDCLFSWLQRDQTCPLCRQDAASGPVDPVTKCLALNAIVAHTEEIRIGQEEMKERAERKRAVEAWEAHAGGEKERVKRSRAH